jgi:hypothetical protein
VVIVDVFGRVVIVDVHRTFRVAGILNVLFTGLKKALSTD